MRKERTDSYGEVVFFDIDFDTQKQRHRAEATKE